MSVIAEPSKVWERYAVTVVPLNAVAFADSNPLSRLKVPPKMSMAEPKSSWELVLSSTVKVPPYTVTVLILSLIHI